ncbi:hypothetical protein B9Z55_020907 [Caenorhabditis nigoni]|uniref:Serpentine receptor class gamma n=1 Tax=Caenorhabditis nigoni TaxID=1611254 RepID=A0A2G5TPM7_9PELO|nr:hypothetical protein B9Z55_020907 [Caenorhabditis nigoni]
MSSLTCIPTTSYYGTPEFLTQTVHIITAVSFPIHILGLFIIIFKTPKTMNSVKWYILHLHIWIMVFDNSLGFSTIPFLLLPTMSGYSLGLLENFGVDDFFMVVLVLLACISKL